jgi:hypothetical protein
VKEPSDCTLAATAAAVVFAGVAVLAPDAQEAGGAKLALDALESRGKVYEPGRQAEASL